MDRRTFLKIAGMGSMAFASACTVEGDKKLYSLVSAPSGMVSGRASWYASTCRECPAGCGVLAKNREGRIVKLEGNPLHPVNKGRLCIRGQAALQGIYNPDRLKAPVIKQNGRFAALSFDQATTVIRKKAAAAQLQGRGRIKMLTESVGDCLLDLFTRVLHDLNAAPPLVFEPLAYESLKTANQIVFGVEGLASYHMDRADLLISFGADFLETWLSPVEYARQFKALHAVKGNRKHLFFHIAPYCTLTGANSDHWLACRPDSEAVIALGLIKEMLDRGKGRSLVPDLFALLNRHSAAYTPQMVAQYSGVSEKMYARLIEAFAHARRPLLLGPANTCADPNGLTTHVAVNLLNLMLDPEGRLIDFTERQRVEIAARRSDIQRFFDRLPNGGTSLVLLNNVNPLFTMPTDPGLNSAFASDNCFVVCFSSFMDETAAASDLVVPVRLPLETWDEYGAKTSLVATLQPAMGRLNAAPHPGDLMLAVGARDPSSPARYKDFLIAGVCRRSSISDEHQWARLLQQGGRFSQTTRPLRQRLAADRQQISALLARPPSTEPIALRFAATPSIRFFDGRGANKPWLCEIPDALSRVAWQSPINLHPATAAEHAITNEDVVEIQTESGTLIAPVYVSELAVPGLLSMQIGQGHRDYGRYARHRGYNPLQLLSAKLASPAGSPVLMCDVKQIRKTGRREKLACTAGSRIQHGRTLALSVSLTGLQHEKPIHSGLTMGHFPLTLPLPEGYDPRRDVYPAHDHDTYRWAMVVDLDRCIGCGACAAACYAENNIGVVGRQRILEGREMAWLSIERYHDPHDMRRTIFLPMMCQHCDNAPCESVCPVYAPHHSKEGLNNQIYNRCIGTRYCVQNCPYKVRRFNWFTWQWPDPLHLQLNPDVTVRSKGVMEKCSFCIQRIKSAHNAAKNERRAIKDGEVIPACVQTCPTQALCFGNLMDTDSRVRKRVNDPRAYQALGYLNTKPAVIYLKKVVMST